MSTSKSCKSIKRMKQDFFAFNIAPGVFYRKIDLASTGPATISLTLGFSRSRQYPSSPLRHEPAKVSAACTEYRLRRNSKEDQRSSSTLSC
ncbi:hypothetical protein CBOM_03465 [Ceraceosorus bombacis]|uniref:Uncharacterized protein n=1 Tax=Ceraceosorus bombacis TaxID=401625 RepID=A0A0P1BM48_9BASI|nr:hypothetical protein CBOM_03465 [Ceraceosorus bombacis]